MGPLYTLLCSTRYSQDRHFFIISSQQKKQSRFIASNAQNVRTRKRETLKNCPVSFNFVTFLCCSKWTHSSFMTGKKKKKKKPSSKTGGRETGHTLFCLPSFSSSSSLRFFFPRHEQVPTSPIDRPTFQLTPFRYLSAVASSVPSKVQLLPTPGFGWLVGKVSLAQLTGHFCF